jgi:hypothetical protein
MYATGHNGPLVLVDGRLESEEDLQLAARITARYCRVPPGEQVMIEVVYPDESKRQLTVVPLPEVEQKLEWTLQ